MHVRIILVEPHEEGNVGAAARAMKNFGLSDLTIVGTRPRRIGKSSLWWASGAEDLVESARSCETLQEALADCHLSVATTAARQRDVLERLTPRSLCAVASASLGPEHRLAVVFGREEWGLTSGEIALCQRTASIPTAPEFPTMNLAQSVTIFCYELTRALRDAATPADPAPGDLLAHLHEHASRLLLEIDFLQEQNPDRIYRELQAIAGRALLTTREASLLLDLIRGIERRLGIE